MSQFFSFLFPNKKNLPQPPTSLKPKVINNSQSEEYDKITKYHYQSKFTAINDKIHETLNSKSPNQLGSPNIQDLEEIEMFSFNNENVDDKLKLDLCQFDFLILAFVCFCVEFGYSLEIVFITPHFMILDLPPFLDTLIWLFPPLVVLIIYPFLQILIEPSHYLSFFQKKLVLVFLIFVSGVGLYFLSICETLAIRLSLFHNYSQINYYSIVFSILGFLFVDIANELINYIVNHHITNLANQAQHSIADNYICYGSSLGKISGYFVSSFLAFNIFVDKIKKFRNFVNFAFTIGLIVQSICFLLFLFLFPVKPQQKKGKSFSFTSYINELRKLSLNNFMPGITLLKKIPNQMKIILLMHFFASCNILMISVYASSWVGVSILKIDPENTIMYKRRKIFDLGISWGSVALLFSALTGFLTEIFIEKLKKFFTNKQLFIITQAISSITLLILYNTDAFYSVFLILPLCGIAFGTFNTIPELMTEELEVSRNLKGVYKQMLKITLFLGEVMMFFGIPCFFLFTPDVNEILTSLIIAGVSGLISVILCYYS